MEPRSPSATYLDNTQISIIQEEVSVFFPIKEEGLHRMGERTSIRKGNNPEVM